MRSVDYRLARKALLLSFERGLASQADVCDAHPELLRAASHIGEAVSGACPICEASELRHVLYCFGKDLKRRNGHVRRADEIGRLRDEVDEFTTYVVEVCTECRWNHLVRAIVSGRNHRRDTGRAAESR